MSFLKNFFDRLFGNKPAAPVQVVNDLPSSFSGAPVLTPVFVAPTPTPAPTPEPVAPPPAPAPEPVAVEAPKKKRGRPPKKK